MKKFLIASMMLGFLTFVMSGKPTKPKKEAPDQPFDYFSCTCECDCDWNDMEDWWRYNHADVICNVHTKPGSDKYQVDQWGSPKKRNS